MSPQGAAAAPSSPAPPVSVVGEEGAATDMEVDDDAFVLAPRSDAPSRRLPPAQEPSVAASVQPLSLHESSAGSGGESVEVPASLGCKRTRGYVPCLFASSP